MHQNTLRSPSSATSMVSSSSNGANNNTNGNNSGEGGSLFNPDEVRFMHDSLSSADSFDPFTIGAPGFKVPNVLPANLGGIGSAPRSNSAGASGAGRATEAMRDWSGGEKDSGSDHNYQHYPQHQHQQQQHQHHQSIHPSSQPHANQPNPTPIRGGYGRDKAWQLQQLESLQAERQKYLSNQSTQSMPEEMASSSSMPDFAHMLPTGHTLNGMDPGSIWVRNENPQRSEEASYPQQTYAYQDQDPMLGNMTESYMTQNVAMDPSSAATPSSSNRSSSAHDLGHLGLNFPSSHQFPAAPRTDAGSSKRQRRVKGEGTEGVGMEGEAEEGEGRRRGRSPSTRPPWTQPPNVMDIQPSSVMGTAHTSTSTRNDSLPKGSSGMAGKEKQGSADSAGPRQQMGPAETTGLTIDMDAPYTFLPAPRPPPKLVDVSKAEGKRSSLPPTLSQAFFSSNLSRFQPHLLLLRQEQMDRKARGLSANVRKGDKKASAKDDGSPDGVEGAEAEKKKAGHVLLTEAEKKANHIASEQKRRANIRKGYEMLCDLIPALNEAEEVGEEDGMGVDEEEGGEEEEELKRGKRRRNCDSSGGDRIDGRAGPRSEAAILLAAVEHLRGQLEAHRSLLIRKQEAQARIAEQYSLDVRPTPEQP